MFRRKPKVDKPPPPSPGVALRTAALTVDPVAVGLSPTQDAPVWGIVMDTAFDDGDGWHCLVTFSDGTTSLYTSAAFGIIGGGAHATVRAASARLLSLVGEQLELLTPAVDKNVPPPGMVTIRALTTSGQLAVTAGEDDLGNNRHPASSIFYAAHEVITQLRLATPPGAGS